MEIYLNYKDFYLTLVDPRLRNGESPESALEKGFNHRTVAKFMWRGKVCEVKADSTLRALKRAYEEYLKNGDDAFIVKSCKTKDALRLSCSPQAAEKFYVYLAKRFEISGESQWRLNEVLVQRRIQEKQLAQELNLSSNKINQLKNQYFIPPIGGMELERLSRAITKLSPEGFKPCSILDLIRG